MGIKVASETLKNPGKFHKQLEDQAYQRGRGGGAGPLIDESLISRLMKESGIIPGNATAILVVDCRMIHDPDSGPSRYHTGSLPSQVEAFVRHPKFDDWLQQKQ